MALKDGFLLEINTCNISLFKSPRTKFVTYYRVK